MDDDPGIRSLFKAILCADGSHCTVVGTAEEAVEAAGKGRYDLAVLDLRLPGMSGAEAAWEIRQRHGNIPIVAVSAYLNQWDRDDLTDLGVDQVLAKPFSPDQLRKAVADAMAARGGELSAEAGAEG